MQTRSFILIASASTARFDGSVRITIGINHDARFVRVENEATYETFRAKL